MGYTKKSQTMAASMKIRLKSVAAAVAFCCAAVAVAGAEPAGSDSSPVLTGKLNAIVLLGDKTSFQSNGAADVSGVIIKDIPFAGAADLHQRLVRYIGQPLTERGRRRLINEVSQLYQGGGNQLVDVSVPPQDMSAGEIQVIVAPRDENKVLVGSLNGIVLLGDPKTVIASGSAGVNGILRRDLPFLDGTDITAKLAPYLGRPLTEKARRRIIGEVVTIYRAKGHPVVDVSTPAQEITSGVLQVLVVEGRAGSIRVAGAKWFDTQSIARQLHLKPGDDININMVQRDLEWLNRNPFRQVDLLYAKGAELGYTDLELRTSDRFPLRVYVGAEDSGTSLTGNDRELAGVNWGNVFGGDGQLNYQFMADHTMSKFRANSGSFVQPLPWRHILTVYGSYADTKADMPSSYFDMNGYSWQAGMRYEVPLSVDSSFRHSVSVGMDYKRMNNDLTFGGISIYGHPVDVDEFSLMYSATRRDSIGQTSLRLSGFFSPGGMTGNNYSNDYESIRSGASSHYYYARAEINRTTRLPYDLMLVNLLTGQVSDSNLLSSEQLGFGGYDTVRGYDTRVVNADQGFIITTELRSPPVAFMDQLGVRGVPDKLQLLAFLDYGVGYNKSVLSGEDSANWLMSIGPGLRYSVATNLSIRADYGFQLNNVETSRRAASRWHLGVVASY